MQYVDIPGAETPFTEAMLADRQAGPLSRHHRTLHGMSFGARPLGQLPEVKQSVEGETRAAGGSVRTTSVLDALPQERPLQCHRFRRERISERQPSGFINST